MKISRRKISAVLVLCLMFWNAPHVFAQTGIAQDPSISEKSPVHAVPKGPTTESAPETISVHFADADIQTVLRILAMKGGVNIVSSPAVQGKVTVDLDNVNWKNVLDLILRNYGYTYVQDGNIIQVFSSEGGAKTQGGEDISSEAITLEYASLDQVKEALSKILPENSVQGLKGSNQIMLRGSSSEIRQARNLISQIDRRMPQVNIDAKIIRTQLGKSETMGVNWSTIAKFAGAKRPTTFPFAYDAAKRGPDSKIKQARFFPQGLTQTLNSTTATSGAGNTTSEVVEFATDYAFPYAKAADFVMGTMDFTQLTAVLNFIQKRHNTRMISSPKITVLNHQAAKVRVGGTVGIPTYERNQTTGALEVTGYNDKNVGVTLEVVPHITKERLIDVDVAPEIAKYLGCEPMAGTTACAPAFDNTTARTRVLIHDGDTLMIAGFISDDETDDRSKIPFINRIPLVGWLAKYFEKDKVKYEVVFFITVNIVDDVFNEKALEIGRQQQADYEAYQRYNEEEFFKKRQKKNKSKDKPVEQLQVKAEAVPAKEEEKQ